MDTEEEIRSETASKSMAGSVRGTTTALLYEESHEMRAHLMFILDMGRLKSSIFQENISMSMVFGSQLEIFRYYTRIHQFNGFLVLIS